MYCKPCGEACPPLCAEDVADGWAQRRVWQAVKKPADHFVTVNDKRFELDSLVCDLCNAKIKDGDQALLVSTFRENNPLPAWEHEYAL